MYRIEPTWARRRGFTLIEMVAVLVLVGITAALLLPLLGTGLRSELDYAQRQQAFEDLRSQMDAWLYTYRAGAGADLLTFRDTVNNTPLAAGLTLSTVRWVRFDDSTGALLNGADTDCLLVTLSTAQSSLTTIFAPQP